MLSAGSAVDCCQRLALHQQMLYLLPGEQSHLAPAKAVKMGASVEQPGSIPHGTCCRCCRCSCRVSC